jgi:DNA helicase HerA-like ATPase
MKRGYVMIGKVWLVTEDIVELKLEETKSGVINLINNYVVFEADENRIIGEVRSVTADKATVSLVGEIKNNIFTSGIINKPNFNHPARLINADEFGIIFGNLTLSKNNKLEIGEMPLYQNYQVNVRINDFFSNHFAIFGNTGSGKSYSVARLLQNIFYKKQSVPNNANIFLFDVYGEYHNAFANIKDAKGDLLFKTYTTNLKFPDTEILKIPVWLLGADDIALLLGADNHIQLAIIEKALRLVGVFAQEEDSVMVYKNDIIARAILEILYSGSTPSQIRDQIFAVLTVYNTKVLNLESKIIQPGYTRSLRQCLVIDRDGKLNEMQLVTEFIVSFIRDDLELRLPDGSFPYTLDNLKEAFEFSLISEGILKSDKVYDYANILKVRLHSLINSDYRTYFDYEQYISKDNYIRKLLTMPTGKKAQIVNFNISYIDDRFAKVITKIYAKLFYDLAVRINEKASFPIHIILEEAHRYVQNDNDLFLLGYNIFDRITKEGRKYGIILGLVSQRPSELSETALSQCSNFLIFRMIHPGDIEFIKNMVPDMAEETVRKLKILRPGICVGFGNAFKIPVIVQLALPNPEPHSKSADIETTWYQSNN